MPSDWNYLIENQVATTRFANTPIIMKNAINIFFSNFSVRHSLLAHLDIQLWLQHDTVVQKHRREDLSFTILILNSM